MIEIFLEGKMKRQFNEVIEALKQQAPEEDR
jgi:hypothetical protein